MAPKIFARIIILVAGIFAHRDILAGSKNICSQDKVGLTSFAQLMLAAEIFAHKISLLRVCDLPTTHSDGYLLRLAL